MAVNMCKDSAAYLIATEFNRVDQDDLEMADRVNYGRVELNWLNSVPNGGSPLARMN